MGYLTTVTLTTDQDNELIDAAIIGALHKMVDFDVIGNNCKWYSRQEDVKKNKHIIPKHINNFICKRGRKWRFVI